MNNNERAIDKNASRLKRLVESNNFNIFIALLIFAGAAIVGLSTFPHITSRWGTIISLLDGIIIALFTVEVLLRIFSETPHPLTYFKDPWNLFDMTIVILCLLPFDSDAVVAVRLVRLLRVMRIFRALPKLRLLIRGIAHSMSSVGYVAILLFIHFYLFAVVGVSLFAQHDTEHFGHLGRAFLTLFQVLTLENWPDVLAPVKLAHPVGGVLYFVGFIVTGTMVVMNLFVGVIVGGMSEAIEETKADEAKAKEEKELVAIRQSLTKLQASIDRLEERGNR